MEEEEALDQPGEMRKVSSSSALKRNPFRRLSVKGRSTRKKSGMANKVRESFYIINSASLLGNRMKAQFP